MRRFDPDTVQNYEELRSITGTDVSVKKSQKYGLKAAN